MPKRAAIVTGASRGIGRALAEALAGEGYDLTITARKPDTLEEAAVHLSGLGSNVEQFAGNLADEEVIKEVVSRHRERFGRLDVLVNNAGLGIGAGAGEHATKHIDLQLDVNLRAIIVFYRECAELLSVYGATKAAVISYTRSMNAELGSSGVKSVAFCPGFVDTDMTEFVRGQVPREEMLRTSDIAEALRFLLRVSPACVVPEIVFARPGEPV